MAPNKKSESDLAKPALGAAPSAASAPSAGSAGPSGSPPRKAAPVPPSVPALQAALAAGAPLAPPAAQAKVSEPARSGMLAASESADPQAAAAAAAHDDVKDWDEAQRIADMAVERGVLEPSQLRFLQKLHSDLQAAGSHKSLYQVLEAAKIIDYGTLIALRDEVRQSKPQRLGDYELLAQLGSGNTGQVYRAKHVVKGYEAALRVLSPALVGDKPFLEKFLKSARDAARLEHPHLIRTLEVGDEKGTYFLVSALVEGESLEQSVEDHGPLQPLEALQMAEHILLALTYLHREGVQHHNIRPENIMLDNANKTARLSDTGHVKPPVRRDKLIGEAADGTMNRPTYAAPEQIFSSLGGDARTDLYSLGACLYFALTGVAPLTSMELARLSSERGPSLDPRQQNEDIPMAAAAFTQWLMGWTPDQRPADAQEALKKLVHILAQLKTKLKKSSRVDVTASVDRIQRDAEAPGGATGSAEKRRKSKRLSGLVTARGRTTVLADPDENPVHSPAAEPVIVPKYLLISVAVALGMALGGMLAAIIILIRH